MLRCSWYIHNNGLCISFDITIMIWMVINKYKTQRTHNVTKHIITLDSGIFNTRLFILDLMYCISSHNTTRHISALTSEALCALRSKPNTDSTLQTGGSIYCCNGTSYGWWAWLKPWLCRLMITEWVLMQFKLSCYHCYCFPNTFRITNKWTLH